MNRTPNNAPAANIPQSNQIKAASLSCTRCIINQLKTNGFHRQFHFSNCHEFCHPPGGLYASGQGPAYPRSMGDIAPIDVPAGHCFVKNKFNHPER
jgi:hypothetical protein